MRRWYATDNLLDFFYHQKYYNKLISFTETLDKVDGLVMFIFAEKQQKLVKINL